MHRKSVWLTGLLAVLALVATASGPDLRAQGSVGADAAYLLKAHDTYRSMLEASPYRSISWQFIGPTNFSGRATDIAVADKNGQRRIYVAGATGGVWKTDDNGQTWQAIFERQATPSIGDIATAPSNPDIVWVGTGEANIFRASMTGTGIYKSTDAGGTWQQMGLTDTQTISRIVIHPTNPDIVYVASSGHEWTDNEARGVFKTTDGGRTWAKVFYRSPRTGAIDLVMDPADSNTLYAAMWQRVRRKWSDPRVEPGYTEGGVWKTSDAGRTWTAANDGLPSPEFRGRIGLDVSRSNPNVLYALIDSYDRGRAADEGERDAYGRPLPPGKGIIRGMEIYRTDDKARTWRKVSGQTPQTATAMMSLTNTYGWVFAQVRVDPHDENTVYAMGLGINVSHDGGATFTGVRAGHGDNHAMWIDPANSKTIYNGNDGGFTMSEDGGQTWRPATAIHLTQFYNVEIDNDTPFHVFGSIQDDGSRRVALEVTRDRDAVQPLPWESVRGGEGSNFAIDPANPNIFYSHQFYGNFSRNDLSPADASAAARGRGQSAAPPGAEGQRGRIGTFKPIKPQVAAGAPELRAQWMAPIVISPFDHQTIYAGFQYLFRSNDAGDTWERISGDLTDNNPAEMGENPSAIPYQTITQIAPSPRQRGSIYVGTDDGRLHVTTDDGKTWSELTKNLPQKKWISRIVASQLEPGTVYVAERGREDDDFAVYVYKSTDFGRTFRSLAANLPAGPVNVIREHPKNAAVLYAGTDFGAFVSTNGGQKWEVLGGNLPTVQVSDLQYQPREDLIVISTYGRGMFVLNARRVK